LIPGGAEFGVFPVSMYIEVASKLRAVCERFLRDNVPVRCGHPYQGRALSFCCERLGSWLVIDHLEKTFGKPFVKSGPSLERILSFGQVPFNDYSDHFEYSSMFGFMHCVEPVDSH
jgi:hypothetical protein